MTAGTASTIVSGTDDVVMWLSAEPGSVGVARDRVRRLAGLSPEAEAVLALLVSEVMTAAVAGRGEARGQRVEVRIGRPRRAVRVTVRSTGLMLASMEPDTVEDPGLGRLLLERLADRWGEAPGELWFELDSLAGAWARA